MTNDSGKMSTILLYTDLTITNEELQRAARAMAVAAERVKAKHDLPMILDMLGLTA